MTVFERIVEWNKDRNNLTFDSMKEFDMLLEELEEFGEATTDEDMVDALCDLIVVATGGLFKLGYDPEKCMDEVIKHISSRKQDPQQKEVWDKWGASGKWQKQKDQDPSTLYEPNYERCKI